MGNTPEQTSTRQVQPGFGTTIDIKRVIEIRREVTIDPVKERLGYDGSLRQLMPVSKVCTGCSVWGGKDTAAP
jgi:hypothetical protein